MAHLADFWPQTDQFNVSRGLSWGSPMNLYSGNGHTMCKKSSWREFVMVNSQIGAKTPKNSIVENSKFFRCHFEVVSSTFPDEPRVPRRAPEPKNSYAVKNLTFRTNYTG